MGPSYAKNMRKKAFLIFIISKNIPFSTRFKWDYKQKKSPELGIFL